MIDFMIISLPRSGSTFLANWLTADGSVCLHDPLANYSLPEIEGMDFGNKKVGIADTSLFLMPKLVNAHPAKKLVVVRDVMDVNNSLRNIGLPEVDPMLAARMNSIEGMRVEFDDIFSLTTAKSAHNYLTGLHFDAHRFNLLTEWNVQPEFRRWTPDASRLRAMIDDLNCYESAHDLSGGSHPKH